MIRRTLGASAALLTLLVLAGCGHDDPSTTAKPDRTTRPSATTSATTSATPAALPTGAAPRVPYLVGPTTLYVDGKARRGTSGIPQTQGRTTLVTVGNYDGGDPAQYEVLRGSHVTARFTSRSAVLSRDGSKVAWVEVTKADAHLVEIDAATGHELGRAGLDRSLFARDGEESEAWESLAKVDDDGTVSYGGVAASHTWTPGHAPVDVPLRNDGAPPAGFPWRAGWDVALAPTTDWGAWVTNHRGRTNARGTDGWVNDGVTLQRAGKPSTKETIALPHRYNAGSLTWESPTELIVYASDDPQQTHWTYLRCDITTKACELAATTGGH